MKTFLLLLASTVAVQAQIRIPAFTAYTQPETGGPRVSQASRITGWKDPNAKVFWFGEFKTGATVAATLQLRLPENQRSRLRLSVAGQSREAEMKGSGTNLISAHFGKFDIQ